ncbi:hypothetical protein GUJ93_ZPchr0012g21352 [Zizania palustris]|uniref:Uncharacterized protein n=1 Tax=Zizania palustris TaxID=103762 RepID=A0A8J5WJ34_ZIZPA|nr:hypothetical protein GUJ93_ZPchr0012g21352 [Zizania palustris]
MVSLWQLAHLDLEAILFVPVEGLWSGSSVTSDGGSARRICGKRASRYGRTNPRGECQIWSRNRWRAPVDLRERPVVELWRATTR